MIAFITIHELQGLTAQQLGEVHQHFTTLLAKTDPNTPDRRNILATLENIERALSAAARPKPSRPFTISRGWPKR